jgi:hypothetical protein
LEDHEDREDREHQDPFDVEVEAPIGEDLHHREYGEDQQRRNGS